MGEIMNIYNKIYLENLKESDNLVDLGVDWRIKLKRTSEY
jgi:hypothetical protein